MKTRAQVLVLSLFVLGNVLALAQDCQFGGKKAFEKTEGLLSHAESCNAAVNTMHACAWGSSADSQLAPIARAKCEKNFLTKLSERGKLRYEAEMQFCSYRYARQDGTMYISAAALCQVDVAAHFAAQPADAEKPVPRASFKCSKAKTALEKEICSDAKLGRADIVLSRVYAELLKNIDEANKSLLKQSQKKWLQRIPLKCRLPLDGTAGTASDCAREEFERRFTDLDGCFDETTNCLTAIDTEEMQPTNSKP